ncbi:MAG: hypothetical protein KAT65_00505 [Methanophagales archaeon]|nr:hypothetical protein [Methanophagales archaeon]
MDRLKTLRLGLAQKAPTATPPTEEGHEMPFLLNIPCLDGIALTQHSIAFPTPNYIYHFI